MPVQSASVAATSRSPRMRGGGSPLLLAASSALARRASSSGSMHVLELADAREVLLRQARARARRARPSSSARSVRTAPTTPRRESISARMRVGLLFERGQLVEQLLARAAALRVVAAVERRELRLHQLRAGGAARRPRRTRRRPRRAWRRGLVEQIERAVRQAAFGHVALGELHREPIARLADLDAVVALVARRDSAQDLGRLLERRLGDRQLREQPEHLRVALFGRFRPPASSSPSTRNSERISAASARHRWRCRSALARTAARCCAAPRSPATARPRASSFFTRSSISPRKRAPLTKAPAVDLEQFGRHQAGRHVARGDALRQRAHDRALAHARLADRERMVLLTALQDREQTPHLGDAQQHRLARIGEQGRA